MVTKKAVKVSSTTPIKKAVKKSSPPLKLVSKKSGKLLPMVVAREEFSFWTSNGSILGNLKELELAFKSMSNEVYNHHVNKNKNDFASWVAVILKDRDCADDLKKAKTAKSARLVVTKHLKKYI